MKQSKNLAKKILSAMMIAGMMSVNSNVYASQIVVKPSATPVVKTSQVTYITFDKEEYVRITQPTTNKKETLVFSSQLNIMGEAREGTNIVIRVYTKDKDNKEVLYKTYEVAEVGATQTFNQLIELKVGENKIVVSYTYKDNEDPEALEAMIIKRATEEQKEGIKNTLVDVKQPFLASTIAK